MNGRGAGEPLDRAVERVDAPFFDLAQIDVERRLVELNDVDPVRLQRARLGVEQIGESHRHLHPIAIVGVRHGIDDGHRSRQRELEFVPGVRAGKPCFARMHPRFEAQG